MKERIGRGLLAGMCACAAGILCPGPATAQQPLIVDIAVELPAPPESCSSKSLSETDKLLPGLGTINDNQPPPPKDGAGQQPIDPTPQGAHTTIPAGTGPGNPLGGKHGGFPGGIDLIPVNSFADLHEAHRILALAETIYERKNANSIPLHPCRLAAVLEVSLPPLAGFIAAGPGFSVVPIPSDTRNCPQAIPSKGLCIFIREYDLDYDKNPADADNLPLDELCRRQERAFAAANDVLALKGRLLVNAIHP